MSDDFGTDDRSGFSGEPVAEPTTEPGEAGVAEDAPETPDEPGRPAWFWWAIAGGAIILVILVWLLFFRSPAVAVPQTVGLTQEAAEATLTASGLEVGRVSEVETLAAAPGIVVEQSPEAAENANEGSEVDLVVATLPIAEVPDVLGKNLSEAEELLALEGLRVGDLAYEYNTSVDAGKVISQDPVSGTDLAVGSAVAMTVSKGEKQEQVPNVVGLPASDAETVLEQSGFVVKSVKAESNSVPPGDVVSQSPAAGVVTDPGSTVTITVSTGVPEVPEEPVQPPASGQSTEPAEPPASEKPQEPEPSTKVLVPDVIGMRVLEAFSALRELKLKIDIAFGPSADYVLEVAAQDPAPGTEVDRGTAVTVTIGLPDFLFGGDAPEVTPLPAPTPEATTLPAPAPGTPDSPGGEAGSLEATTQ